MNEMNARMLLVSLTDITKSMGTYYKLVGQADRIPLDATIETLGTVKNSLIKATGMLDVVENCELVAAEKIQQAKEDQARLEEKIAKMEKNPRRNGHGQK